MTARRTSPARMKLRRKWSDERFAGDAPATLRTVEEKQAWAAGWNAAARESRLAAVSGRWGSEEAAEREKLT